ncbi:glycoside hydrolase family 113 [Lacisediminihabitans changchengi]|nr:1,4-beta-xylanase [Lacisediminihabitans changchengi]
MSAVEVLDAPFCGMTWGWTGIRGTWDTDSARESMRLMVETTAVNWVTIAYAAEQEHAYSTAISFREAPTVTDDEIRGAIREAKALGLRVCLKPVVNVADGTWRAHIGFFDWDVPGEPTWGEWFESYTEFIVHAATIAAEEGCELFCVGCEMVRADAQADRWRALIARVREIYAGLVTYNCDKYQEDHITWWDAVDVIGSSGYYPLGSWDAQLERIRPVVEKFDRPFLFMESGCPSRSDSPSLPNDWSLPGHPDGDAQLRWYDDAFAAIRARPWVRGVMLWDWPARLYPASDAATNDDYCPYGKPAQEFLREQYSAWRAS